MRISYGVILTGLLATAGPLTNIQLPEGRPTNLPQDLEALAELMDCGPVPGFFDRPGMVEPPYLYGYVPGWKGNSAVFWCYRSEDEPYLLVAMRDGKIHSHFEWWGGLGGLSLDSVERRSLSTFVYLDDRATSGPAGVYTQYRPFVAYYDGLTEIFYEHNGRWLVRATD